MSSIKHHFKSIFKFFLDVDKDERVKVLLLTVGFFFVSCVVFTCSLDLLCFVLCIPPTVVLALTRLTEFLSGTRSPTTDRKLGNQLFIFAKTTSLTVWLYRNSNPDISFRRGVPFPLRR